MTERIPAPQAKTVLCVDDDRDVTELIEAILGDQGYRVVTLTDYDENSLLREIGRVEPDVLLLDSASPGGYGQSWATAATIAERSRPVSVVMFTAHSRDLEEAVEGTSERATAAGFASVVPKPFHLDELVAAIAVAAGLSTPFDRSRTAETKRTRALVEALEARGATDVRPSKMREWALFRVPSGRLLQLYWWQQRGVYQVGRYRESGQLVMLGQFVNRDGAIEAALSA